MQTVLLLKSPEPCFDMKKIHYVIDQTQKHTNIRSFQVWQTLSLTSAYFWQRNSAGHRTQNKHRTGSLSHSGSRWNPWDYSCRGLKSAWPHLSVVAACTRWADLWRGCSVRRHEEEHKSGQKGPDTFHWCDCSEQSGSYGSTQRHQHTREVTDWSNGHDNETRSVWGPFNKHLWWRRGVQISACINFYGN